LRLIITAYSSLTHNLEYIIDSYVNTGISNSSTSDIDMSFISLNVYATTSEEATSSTLAISLMLTRMLTSFKLQKTIYFYFLRKYCLVRTAAIWWELNTRFIALNFSEAESLKQHCMAVKQICSLLILSLHVLITLNTRSSF
jgi:hypothetical protein